MTKEHEQAIKILEGFTDHFHRNIEQAEKTNDCSFDFTQAEDAVITFGIAIHAIKDFDKLQNVLDEIRAEIEEQVLESLSDGGDDWFAAEKVNDCLEIVDKHRGSK